MNEIKSYSPTRVDLAGGTLDLWPLFNFVEQTPVTVNLGINIFTYATLKLRTDSKVVLDTLDLGVRKEFENLDACLRDETKELKLLRCIVSEFMPVEGFELQTKSESPVGGGLGGSSSLCISIIKAFCSWLEKDMDPNSMVRLAHNIESRMLGTPTGTQDYYPPILGGMLSLQYAAAGVDYQSIDFDLEQFNDHMTLVYTGKPHVSGLNNWEVMKKAVDQDVATLSSLNSLAKVAAEMEKAVKAKDWSSLPEIFDAEYRYRTELSPVFSSKQIKELKALADAEGALATKICGAGGGGCVLLWNPPENRENLESKINEAGFQVLSNKAYVF